MTQQPHMSRTPRRAVFGLLTMVALIALLAGCSPAAQPAASQPTAAQPAAAVQPTAAPAAAQSSGQAAAAATFAKDVQPILQQNCVKCHGNSAAGGLALTSYDALMKGGRDGQVIVPGDAADSELVKVIVSGRMPQGGKKLSQSQIDIISAWVTAGAQDN